MGGSFVLYVAKNQSAFLTDQTIDLTIEEEHRSGLQQLQTYTNFTKQVEQNKMDLLSLLNQLKASGKRVFGLGAPLKGSTLLNYYQIGPELLEYVTEVNPYKINKYTPGTHIPIVHEDSIRQQPDYYLVLSWNFLDFFIEKYAHYLENGGKFIVPHPNVKIIDKVS